MPLIELHTEVAAPIERVFDLSRSIDLHVASTAHTGEAAIAGVTSGLLGRIVSRLVLTGHLRELLVARNQVVRSTAESDDWRTFLEKRKL